MSFNSQPSPSLASPTSPRPTLRHLSSSDSGYHSPRRHHHRLSSAPRVVKETHNAHSQYSNSDDSGTSQLRINQYLVKQEIGRGAFGAVHLAVDQYGTEYAVKEFSKSRLRRRAKSGLLRHPRLQARRSEPLHNAPFGLDQVLTKPPPLRPPTASNPDNSFDLIRMEIAVMKKLNHPNVVGLIEVLDDPREDSLYMVLEMCKKGVVLKVDIEEDVEPYDEDNCRTWFRDLILAIEYLHAQGIVHRDIKPDNCLLTEDNVLKVVDFGVSEMFEKTSEMKLGKKSAGSPAFQAPELCVAQRDEVFGKPADIWAMGATLYCLRFGRVPFRQNALLDLYDAIVKEDIHLPDNIGPDFRDLMLRIFEKDPAKRITMQEMREHDWVTRRGEDCLLSFAENCPEVVEPPTETEVNEAITGNMGRVLAVIKAAKKFKSLLHKDRPELVNSVLGQASRFVRPPSAMSPPSLSEPTSAVGEGHPPITETNLEEARAALDAEGDHVSARLVSQLSRLPERVRTAVVSQEDDSPELPDSPQSLRKSRTDPGPIDHMKGHAHDPLEDEIFLNIGAGPSSYDGTFEKPTASDQAELTATVCESPSGTDVNVYERAYREEVQRIYMRQGKEATIFLTRRMESKAKEKWKGFADDHSGDPGPSASTSDKLKSGFVGVVNKAVETGKAAKQKHDEYRQQANG